MMIRPAVEADLPVLSEMAAPVMAELQPRFPFHRATAVATLRRRMESPLGLVAVLADEGGVFGGLTAEAFASPWARGLHALCDLRWVDPARRGRWGHALMRHFEAWGRGQGAVLLGVSQTGREAAGYYERLGYHPAEMMFWKAL